MKLLLRTFSNLFFRGKTLCPCTSSRKNSSEIDEEEKPRAKPVGLEGKNWRTLREKQKLGNAKWEPRKRLTWHQIEHLRTLRKTQPEEWTKTKLARSFGISLPAVTRILHSKFEGSDEMRERQDAKARRQTEQRREAFQEKLRTSTVTHNSEQKTPK